MLLYIAAALAVLLSFLLALVTRSLTGAAGTSLLVVRLVAILIGLIAAGVLLWLAQKRKKANKEPDGKATHTVALDDLLREANRRLAASPQTGVKSLRGLPLLYVLGEAGSSKTTSVIKSGLEPELLAGQIYREKMVVATQLANVWFSKQTALVEVGEEIRQSAGLWGHLIAQTRPAALHAATKGAPFRAAIVCVSCEQMMGAQTTETMQAAAAVWNVRLRELASQLGSPVPVYVLLTKLDRVPGFTEYVRNLSAEEGMVLLGGAPQWAGKGTEQALAAATASIDSVLFSLGEARLDLLARETDAQQLSPAYQFPRELKRFRNLLSTYLVELVRPSQLDSNPELRAFCFTGVRPIVVQQVAATSQAVAPSPRLVSDATGVFQVPQASAPAPAAAPSVYGEKIAQWTFLSRFFPEVVLGDGAALGATRQTGSGRMLMRLVYGTASALLFVYLLLLASSYFANSALQNRIQTASDTLAQAGPAGSALQTNQLVALDQLRGSLLQLEEYRLHGAPLRYRWGLYRGDLLLQPARSMYFARFRDLLLTRTQNNILTELNALPASPAQNGAAGNEYNQTYSALRAYLITTQNADKSTVDFLSPVLLTHLQKSGAAASPEDSALAQKQFDYYASVLPDGNPFAITPVAGTVSHARGYLAGFGGFERIYQSIVSAAEKTAPAVRFTTQYPNAAGVLQEPHVIPGAYSKAGFAFMQEALAHPERYFSGEAWVLGEQAPQSIDTGSLKAQLTTRYRNDYLSQWRAFLKDAAVAPYANLQDAGKKLVTLSKNDSPLLALLYTVSHNTALGNADIAASFQAPQAVVPPSNTDQWIGASNKAYVDSLLSLTQAVSSAATASGDPAAAAAPVSSAATAAHLAAQQLGQSFRIDRDAHMDGATLSLLEEPITDAEGLVRKLGPAQANGGGKGFCSAYNALLAKAPFNLKATNQATPAELAALLQPVTGALWQFYNANLKTLIAQQGSEYVAIPNAPVQVSPAFLKFFNRMASLSQQMFPGTTTSPTLSFVLRNLPSGGVQSSTLKIDAQSLNNTDTQKQFTWNGQTAQEASLTANSLPLSVNGPWAAFQLLGKAHSQKSANGYELSFPLELANTPVKAADGTPVVVRYELSGAGADVIAPGALSTLHCVAEVAK